MHALRGHQSIYTQLLFDDQPMPEMKVVERKGRSERLKNLQNELIVCRYYYYAKIIRKNYPDTLDELENELFLSQLTITRIVQANRASLKQMIADKVTVTALKKRYPFLVW